MKSRRLRRTYRKRNLPRLAIKSNAMMCTRKVVLGTVGTQVGTGWTSYPYSFRFDDIVSYAELQSVFDCYKINAIKLTFTPYWDSNDVSNQTGFTGVLPRVFTLIDRNGIPSGALATEDLFLEYGNARQIRNPQRPFNIYIKAPGVELSSAGAITSLPAVTKYKPWIDTSNTTIPHNGCAIGMVIPAGTSTMGFYYHVVATFYLQFKNVV
ncbi:MAG: hypothetical protein H7836_17370 [Magnetococcus sp. YQC-3]